MDKLWLHHIIKDTLLKEDYRYQYDKGYNPPFNVRSAAKYALMAVQQNKKVQSDASNEGSGLQKAKDLSNGIVLNHGQLKRMKAFFDNNYDQVQKEKMAGKDITNSGVLQSWELWGGDSGREWVSNRINSLHDKNDSSKNLRPKGQSKLMDPHNTRNRAHHANHFYTNF